MSNFNSTVSKHNNNNNNSNNNNRNNNININYNRNNSNIVINRNSIDRNNINNFNNNSNNNNNNNNNINNGNNGNTNNVQKSNLQSFNSGKGQNSVNMNKNTNTNTNTNSNSNRGSNTFTDFRLRACSPDDLKDLRYHVMRFHSRKAVSFKDFNSPLRMHRRDPRGLDHRPDFNSANSTSENIVKMEEDHKPNINLSNQNDQNKSNNNESNINDNINDNKIDNSNDNSEYINKDNNTSNSNNNSNNNENSEAKKNKDETDLSLIAPDGGARKSKKSFFQRKTKQVFTGNESAKKIRYEEHFPWVLEDFDGKNIWVGNYEAAQSDGYVLFVFDEDGFKIVPAEKWYKFTPRNKYVTLSLEEAEAQMSAKEKVPRWLMKHMDNDDDFTKRAQVHPARRRLKTVDGGSPVKDEEKEELDFDDEFADDEGAPILEGPEQENKEIEDRIKKEMEAARSFADKNDDEELDYDESNDKDEVALDKEGRRLKKYLRSIEKNAVYESEDEGNPYASSDSEDSLFGNENNTNNNDNKVSTNSIQSQKDSKSLKISGTYSSKNGLDHSTTTSSSSNSSSSKNYASSSVLSNIPIGKYKPKHSGKGYTVLRVSSAQLKPFMYAYKKNQNSLKRARAGSEIHDKSDSQEGPKKSKIKVSKSETPLSTSPAPPSPSKKDNASTSISSSSNNNQANSASGSPNDFTPAVSNDPNIITENDVRNILMNNENITINDLLNILKPKLKLHADNKNLIKDFLRQVGRLKDGYVVLKE